MANPFIIDNQMPMQGLNMLSRAMSNRGERKLGEAKEKKYKQLRESVNDVMRNGSPEEVAEFVTKNPGAKDIIDETIKFKSDRTKRVAVEGALERLTGKADKTESLTNQANVILEEGGDATQTLGALRATMQNPEANDEADMKILAAYDKPAFDSFMKLREGDVEEKKTADIKNYDMAKRQGYKGTFVEYQALNKGKQAKSTPDILNYGQAVEGGYKGTFMDFLGEKSGKKIEKPFGDDLTEEEFNQMADVLSETGKYEFTGRAMPIKEFNIKLKKRSLERQKQKGLDAVSTLYSQLDKKGMTKDIDAQQKKLGSMRSFALNIDKQSAKLNKTIDKIFKLDAKILNHPVNKIMTDYIGSADRAVLALLVGELSEEIGKLASGATDSVAALSEGGREKWDKIFHVDLPAKAMKQLVNESKEVALMRVDSMKESLIESKRIRRGGKIKSPNPKYKEGQTATINGKPLIFKDGKWRDI